MKSERKPSGGSVQSSRREVAADISLRSICAAASRLVQKSVHSLKRAGHGQVSRVAPFRALLRRPSRRSMSLRVALRLPSTATLLFNRCASGCIQGPGVR